MTPAPGQPLTAIVTGGARRIGAALVRALAADGWSVLIHCHRSDAEADALAAGLPDARVVVTDLAAADAGAQVLAATADMPPPALLVNNAARFEEDALDGFTASGWDRHLHANLRGPALLIQAFAAAIAAPGGGQGLVVNILDAKVAQPNPDFFSYTVSKLGLAGLTEVAARALAGRGIRVCGIAPALTLRSGAQTAANFAAAHRLNPLGHGVEPEDIAAALRYLIAAPAVTGQVIVLDGGQRFMGLPRDVQFMELE